MTAADALIRYFPSHELLGRKLAVLDPRSRAFAAVGSVMDPTAAIETKTWRRYPRAYDQGRSSECVIYSEKGNLNSTPFRASIERRSRLDLETTPVYKLAQTLDPWTGENYDGTSVLAGAQALKQLGLIDSYLWCFGIDDVLRTISNYGPVVIGVSWYGSMFSTDADGFINVHESSGLAGGHAVQLLGIDARGEYAIGTNSWGLRWGDRGRFKLRWTDLDKLLKDWGEAVTFVVD